MQTIKVSVRIQQKHVSYHPVPTRIVSIIKKVAYFKYTQNSVNTPATPCFINASLAQWATLFERLCITMYFSSLLTFNILPLIVRASILNVVVHFYS